MTVANRELIRAINRFSIINTIRIARQISRVDIAGKTGLSKASVTSITSELIRDNLIVEKSPGESTGSGRRPILLALNPLGAIVVGVKLFIHQISVVVINFEAEIIDYLVTPLEKPYYSPETIADMVTQSVQSCLWQANYAKEQISGLGIGLPGWVDSNTGLVRFLPNYQWENANIRDLVKERLQIPVYVENDANTLAIAEQWFGEGRGIDNFLVITLEYGVGMGAVINGQLYRGQTGISSEFGHTHIAPDGPLCRCGKRGCIEASVGLNAIIREALKKADQGSWIRKRTGEITIEEVFQAADSGEGDLQEIFGNAGNILGVGIANLIQLYNPARIIITGKGVLAGDHLFRTMQATIPQHLPLKLDSRTEIIIQEWSNKDWARGAGTVVLQEIYKSPAHRIIPLI